MVDHIVLFKVRAGATPQQQEAMISALLSLAHRVPGIERIAAGANFSDRSRGFTHGLVVRFTSREALDAYLPHPDHREVVERYIEPITEEVVVVDYACR